MSDESAPRVSWKMRFDHHIRQNNVQSKPGDPPSEFIIVCEIIDDRFEAADLFQVASPERQRRSQAESQPTFDLARSQHTRAEVSTDAQRLELRSYRWSRDSAIQTGHHPHSW